MTYHFSNTSRSYSSNSLALANKLSTPELLWKTLALSCKRLGFPAKRFKAKFLGLEPLKQLFLIVLWFDQIDTWSTTGCSKVGLDRDSLHALFNMVAELPLEVLKLGITQELAKLQGGDYG